MRLSHNMAALNIYKEYSKVLTKQFNSLDKISSGIKVNKAKDNPNSLAQSEKLRMQIRGLQMASNNVQDGCSMLQTAEGGLQEITSMLQRIRELVVQAGSGSNNVSNKVTIQNEINEMAKGVDNISASTESNGVNLLNDATNTSLDIAVGANVGEKIQIPRFNLVSQGQLNLSDASGNSLMDIRSQTGVEAAFNTIDAALSLVLSARSQYGALENRFESSLSNLSEIIDKTEGADSKLRDTDMAEEIVEYSKSNILVEAGNAMMAQANKLPQDILRILDKR